MRKNQGDWMLLFMAPDMAHCSGGGDLKDAANWACKS
jgi:hypothetical protein